MQALTLHHYGADELLVTLLLGEVHKRIYLFPVEYSGVQQGAAGCAPRHAVLWGVWNYSNPMLVAGDELDSSEMPMQVLSVLFPTPHPHLLTSARSDIY